MGRTQMALMAAAMLFAWAAPLGRCAIADRRAIVLDDVEFENGPLTATMRDWSKRMKPIQASEARSNNSMEVPPVENSFADYVWAFIVCGLVLAILSLCALLYFLKGLQSAINEAESAAKRRGASSRTTLVISCDPIAHCTMEEKRGGTSTIML